MVGVDFRELETARSETLQTLKAVPETSSLAEGNTEGYTKWLRNSIYWC